MLSRFQKNFKVHFLAKKEFLRAFLEPGKIFNHFFTTRKYLKFQKKRIFDEECRDLPRLTIFDFGIEQFLKHYSSCGVDFFVQTSDLKYKRVTFFECRKRLSYFLPNQFSSPSFFSFPQYLKQKQKLVKQTSENSSPNFDRVFEKSCFYGPLRTVPVTQSKEKKNCADTKRTLNEAFEYTKTHTPYILSPTFYIV